MTLSRTARILLALLLLAAAAFFWVNFFTQNRVIGEDPETPATAAVPPTPTPPVAPVDDADVDADAPTPDVDVDPEAQDPAVIVTPDVDPEAPDVADPPVVVIDPPITVTRDVVVADLPFLVTEPPAPAEPTAEELAAAAEERALAAIRATVNPFSPIVRPTAPTATATAPVREVPPAPVVTDVPVPGAPPAAPARVATPAPRPLAPAPSVAATPRALPTGTPLAATPGLLRETRTIEGIDRAEVPPVTATRLPDEPVVSPADAVRTAPGILSDVPELRGTAATEIEAPVANGEAPLAAGTNRLARFLRDNGYSFTGSVLGPVSVGVFRSNGDPTPQVVALGQTLPNTEIVLTDLRGQQAELMLDDLRQTLILDIRR